MFSILAFLAIPAILAISSLFLAFLRVSVVGFAFGFAVAFAKY